MALKFLIGLGGEREYMVNGVRYLVSSCFQRAEPPGHLTIRDRFRRIVSGDMVPLSMEDADGTMETEYVCSAAGKEEH